MDWLAYIYYISIAVNVVMVGWFFLGESQIWGGLPLPVCVILDAIMISLVCLVPIIPALGLGCEMWAEYERAAEMAKLRKANNTYPELSEAEIRAENRRRRLRQVLPKFRSPQ